MYLFVILEAFFTFLCFEFGHSGHFSKLFSLSELWIEIVQLILFSPKSNLRNLTFSTNQPSFKRATADLLYSFVGDTFALGLVQAEQKEDQSVI